MLLTIQVAASDAPSPADPEVIELNRAAKAPSDAAIAKFDREQARFRENEAAFKAAQARYQADTTAYEAAMQSYRAGVVASEAATQRWQAEVARLSRSRTAQPAEPSPPAEPKRQVCSKELTTGSNVPQLVCHDRN